MQAINKLGVTIRLKYFSITVGEQSNNKSPVVMQSNT